MSSYPNFREFYHKSPIQMGKNDQNTLQKKRTDNNLDGYTHWVIALEGNEITDTKMKWKVVVFPSEASGCFNFRAPYFVSPAIPSFHEAYQLSHKMSLLAKQDQLSSGIK